MNFNVAARGSFHLLKDADIAAVCKSTEERNVLREVIEAYRHYRLEVGDLTASTVRRVGEEVNKYKANHFDRYWFRIAGYTTLMSVGQSAGGSGKYGTGIPEILAPSLTP